MLQWRPSPRKKCFSPQRGTTSEGGSVCPHHALADICLRLRTQRNATKTRRRPSTTTMQSACSSAQAQTSLSEGMTNLHNRCFSFSQQCPSARASDLRSFQRSCNKRERVPTVAISAAVVPAVAVVPADVVPPLCRFVSTVPCRCCFLPPSPRYSHNSTDSCRSCFSLHRF